MEQRELFFLPLFQDVERSVPDFQPQPTGSHGPGKGNLGGGLGDIDEPASTGDAVSKAADIDVSGRVDLGKAKEQMSKFPPS